MWDRQRGLARVEWRGNRVLFDVNSKKGRVWSKEAELGDGPAKQKLLDAAYAYWINDSFWLNPVVKAFDDGTARARGTVDGKRALLVSYASGGLTPGDKYLWILDDNARPVAWRIWVKIIKIGGPQFTWEGWTQLPTGAWVATSHRALGIDVVHLRRPGRRRDAGTTSKPDRSVCGDFVARYFSPRGESEVPDGLGDSSRRGGGSRREACVAPRSWSRIFLSPPRKVTSIFCGAGAGVTTPTPKVGWRTTSLSAKVVFGE